MKPWSMRNMTLDALGTLLERPLFVLYSDASERKRKMVMHCLEPGAKDVVMLRKRGSK